MSVAVGDVEDATAINNTARQVIGAIGSSVRVVIMQILANGYCWGLDFKILFLELIF